jgi:hypothetical protein
MVPEGLLKIFDFCGLAFSYLGSGGRSPSLLLLLAPIISLSVSVFDCGVFMKGLFF